MPKRTKGPQKHQPAGPTTHWGDVADWYDQLVGEEGSEYHRQVVFPGVFRLLGQVKGQRVLDVACGQGVLCRLLHQQGAQATGVDAAGELIRLARQRSDESIKYLIGDARQLSMLGKDWFNLAACVLGIQNIHPYAPVFRGVSQALKIGGRFVMVMMHPCFRGPGYSAWGWDAPQNVQYRRVDRYLIPRKEPIITHPGKDPGRYTWSFHRPIGDYVRALRNAGLLVDAMEEWASHKTSTGGPRAAAENLSRKEIPMFLAIRAVKVATAEPGGSDDGV